MQDFKIRCQECDHGAHNEGCDECSQEGPKFWRPDYSHTFKPDWEDLQRELSMRLEECRGRT